MPPFFGDWLNIFAYPNFFTILLHSEKNLPGYYRFDQLVPYRHHLYSGVLAQQYGAVKRRPVKR